MPIDIPQAQKNFFFRHHYLELEDFFDENELPQMRAQFETMIQDKSASFYDVFLKYHDVWRSQTLMPLIRKLADVVGTLVDARPLTLAYDQILRTTRDAVVDERFHALSLSETSSVSSLVCGVIINLSEQSFLEPPEELEIGEDVSTLIPLPHTPGSVIFCAPNLPLDYPKLLEIPKQLCYLVTFSNVKPLYIRCEGDLHRNKLKQLGYAFGDHLREETHPIVAH